MCSGNTRRPERVGALTYRTGGCEHPEVAIPIDTAAEPGETVFVDRKLFNRASRRNGGSRLRGSAMECDPVSVGETSCGAGARAGRSQEREKRPHFWRDDRSRIGARSRP